MVNALTASELRPGSAFRDGLVSRSNIEEKRGKGPDIKLTLAADFHRYPAKKWQSDEAEIQLVRSSQFLVISGVVEKDGLYDGEITINSVRAAAEDEIPTDESPYLMPYHEDHDDHVARFESLVASVTNPYLSQLLQKIFDHSERFWPEYCESCAAQKMHHAYRGGLLHHSVEVAELCASNAEVIPSLNRDLLVACALLHDIGKLRELEHGLNAGDYTPAGVLSGHIMEGVIIVRPFMSTKIIPGFPEALKQTVTHMIVSHHGSREFGSPQTPAFPEAHVLAECDMISARVYQYDAAIRDGKEWLPGSGGIRLYTGSLGLDDPPKQKTPPKPVTAFTTHKPASQPEYSFTTVLRIRGLAAAGSPEQGSDEDEGTREVAPPPRGADYLVRVTGDSMVDAGLQERDLLFVKATETPKSGDIVVAHIAASGEVVKRFHRDTATDGSAGNIWLVSENGRENYLPIAVDADTRIRGVVTGLLRDF